MIHPISRRDFVTSRVGVLEPSRCVPQTRAIHFFRNCTHFKELMFDEVIHSWPLSRDKVEAQRDKIFCLVRNEVLTVLLPLVLELLQLCVNFGLRFGGKRRRTNQHRITDDANGPSIDLVAMSFTRRFGEKLWCNVVGSAAHGPPALPIIHNHCRKAKISNLEVHMRIDEEISHLQIPVDNTPLMHVLYSPTYLNHVSTNFRQAE